VNVLLNIGGCILQWGTFVVEVYDPIGADGR
jgi:hypothetical protein